MLWPSLGKLLSPLCSHVGTGAPGGGVSVTLMFQLLGPVEETAPSYLELCPLGGGSLDLGLRRRYLC